MTRTTPPRPLDVEALFPELAGHRGTTTRPHPRAGSPDVRDSSVGGPMLWPADEPWRRSAEVGETPALPPLPEVVGFDGYLPEPCVLHPGQVVTYPFAGLLPEDLRDRIDAWEERLEEQAEESDDPDEPEPVGYQYDLSIPPGWRAGGFASWHLTDPAAMDCRACGTAMELLITVDSSEWDGGSGSWKPVEEHGLPPCPYATPTEVVVGRHGGLNVFACPADPGHPHRWSIQ
ncbi:hypothetical protein [Streptomyces sp. NPDC017890]|uniref:hypothetical protein n=1 Tax=Streptomyces sp. NPDC017890 TaxID=3365015 RepID=UPI003792F915